MKCRTQNQPPPRAVKAAEAAALLGISRRFLSQLTKEGQIACHRYGPRTVAYELTEIERFKEATRIDTETDKKEEIGEQK